MDKENWQRANRVYNVAYLRDGDKTYIGEALLIACIVHTKGSRDKNLKELQKIMRDQNVE